MDVFAYGLVMDTVTTGRQDLQEYLVREFPGCEAEVLPNDDDIYDTLLLLAGSEEMSAELVEACFEYYDDIARYQLLCRRPLQREQSVREGYVDLRKIVSRLRFDAGLDEDHEERDFDEELDEY